MVKIWRGMSFSWPPRKCIKRMSGTTEKNHTSEEKMGSLQLWTGEGAKENHTIWGTVEVSLVSLDFFFLTPGQMKNVARKKPIKSSNYGHFCVCSHQEAIILRYVFWVYSIFSVLITHGHSY